VDARGFNLKTIGQQMLNVEVAAPIILFLVAIMSTKLRGSEVPERYISTLAKLI
jgi:hypothetical protein